MLALVPVVLYLLLQSPSQTIVVIVVGDVVHFAKIVRQVLGPITCEDVYGILLLVWYTNMNDQLNVLTLGLSLLALI